MPSRLLCLLVAMYLLSGCPAHAQSDFRSGYIVTLSGDTVRGLADYRGNALSASICRFRATPEAPVAAYSPAQLRGYGFGRGRQFRSRLLASIDSVQYRAVAPPAPLFLELLATGPLSLYRTRSSAGVDRYFVAPATQPVSQPLAELLPARPDAAASVTTAYRRQPLYRGVLSGLMQNCNGARMAVASVPFTANGLIGIVQRYNRCLSPAAAPAPRVSADEERVRLGLVLGAETSRLVFAGETVLSNAHFASVPFPVLGMSLTIPLASLSEKLILRFETLIDHQRYADIFGGNTGHPSRQQAHLNLTYLRMPLQLRYTYPKGRLRPFAQAGLSYSYRLHFDTRLQEEYATGSNAPQFNEGKTLEEFNPGVVGHELGLVGGVGVNLPAIAGRALSFELRTEASTGPLATVAINSSYRRYSALLGYNFTK